MLDQALDFLVPRCCMLCGTAGDGLCGGCVACLVAPPRSTVPKGVDRMYGICAYEGTGRELVLALKRANRRDGLRLLGESLAEVISTDSVGQRTSGGIHATRPAGVTWAPTTNARRRERGYDQSQLLAAAVARTLGLRARRCLRRTGAAQHGMDVAHRRSNPTFAPAVPPQRIRSGFAGTWVLVDDVVTTGATMSAAAAALRSAGAESVIGAAIAITA